MVGSVWAISRSDFGFEFSPAFCLATHDSLPNLQTLGIYFPICIHDIHDLKWPF